jgi:hypothetical protein
MERLYVHSVFSEHAQNQIAIPEILLNTRDFPSVKLPAQGITYPLNRQCTGALFQQATAEKFQPLLL